MHTNYKKTGSLEVICGPMFSGKSEELIRRLRRAKIAQQRVIVFKHAIDNRYNGTHVTSHNGTTLEAYAINDCSVIFPLVKENNYTVVGIDEVQFFPSQIIDIISLLIAHKVRVIAAGLDLDFRGKPFGPTPTLLALADAITKLCAICTVCGNDAHFSQLLGTTTTTTSLTTKEPLIMVGGTDIYAARCRDCHTSERATAPSTIHAHAESP